MRGRNGTIPTHSLDLEGFRRTLIMYKLETFDRNWNRIYKDYLIINIWPSCCIPPLFLFRSSSCVIPVFQTSLANSLRNEFAHRPVRCECVCVAMHTRTWLASGVRIETLVEVIYNHWFIYLSWTSVQCNGCVRMRNAIGSLVVTFIDIVMLWLISCSIYRKLSGRVPRIISTGFGLQSRFLCVMSADGE